MSEAEAVREQITTVASEIKTKLNDTESRLDRLELAGKAPNYGGGSTGAKTLAGLIAEAPGFEEFKTGRSDRLNVPMESKALIDGSNVAYVDQDQTEIYHPAQRRLRVRDLIPVVPTDSNTVEYTVETAYTNNADEQTSEGATKAESEMTFEQKTATVATVAHFIDVSRQALEDRAGLQAHIDQRMTHGLEQKEEELFIDGSGDVAGFLEAGNHTAYNRDQAGDTGIDTLGRAITQLQLGENTATGIMLNPADWEEIRLSKDNDDRYLWAFPGRSQPMQLHGVPVVVTNSVSEGDFLVGDWQQAAVIRQRENAMVRMSEHTGDNFKKNLVTILAELRVALTVVRPGAVIFGTFGT